jgi:hypothetical protein
VEGVVMPGAEALARVGLAPVTLEAKEGLALVNGTQLMTAAGSLAVAEALRLTEVADITGVMSLETIKGSSRPFDPRITAVRPTRGAGGRRPPAPVDRFGPPSWSRIATATRSRTRIPSAACPRYTVPPATACNSQPPPWSGR